MDQLNKQLSKVNKNTNQLERKNKEEEATVSEKLTENASALNAKLDEYLEKNLNKFDSRLEDLNRRMSKVIKRRGCKEIANQLERENKKDVAAVSEKITENSTALNAPLDENMNKNLRDMDEMMDEELQINSRVMFENLEKRFKNMERKLENHLDASLVELNRKFTNRPLLEKPQGVVSEIYKEVEAPTFDGSTPYDIFKFKFEMVADINDWDSSDKATELILALKGHAAEVLQCVPISSRDNYEAVLAALQRKYGCEHKREIYRMELKNRMQKPNESLQDFAFDVERLIMLTYPGHNHQLLEQLRIDAFLDGIRDSDIKYAVCAAQKSSFNEAVSFALVHETAKYVSRPQTQEVQTIEMESEELKAILKEQRSDPVLAKIIRAKEEKRKLTQHEMATEGHQIKSYSEQWDSLRLLDGCLYRVWESEDGWTDKNLIVLPASKVQEMIAESHNGPRGRHLGRNKTLEKLSRRYYCVGLQQAVTEWIAGCAQCMGSK